MEYIDAKTILHPVKNSHEWFGSDFNMNLYQGCPHGCIYCDSRSECYHVENFDTVRIKKNVISLLQKELRGKRKKGVIGIGAMSDTYNPFEQKYQITRQALTLIESYGFGVSLETKSHLVMRDIDLLQKINRKAPVIIKLSITTHEDALSRIIEPHASLSSERFQAIQALSQAGIYTGILMTPILPYITDTKENILQMVNLSQEAGAKFIFSMGGVTLRGIQRTYYYQALEKHFPGIMQQYIKDYGNDYVCHTKQKEILPLFKKECQEAGLLYRMKDIIAAYQTMEKEKPLQQLSIF